MLGEFELINRYFVPLGHSSPSLIMGIGDDAAIVSFPQPVAITMDTLVEGIHFLHDDPPETIGHKVLAVNLSDLAAMGASPSSYLLAITLPKAEDAWLGAFAQGMSTLADRYGVTLIGGDTTSGPLSITVTAIGDIDPHRCLKRDAAKIGDDIYVTGTLGAAALFILSRKEGIVLSDSALAACQTAYQCPSPRVELGQALLGYAHACIDISDGLVADLGHILKASQVGATLDLNAIPLAQALSVLTQDRAQALAISGGDDYELCFTAPVSARESICHIAKDFHIDITRIGGVTSEAENMVLMRDNQILDWSLHGWEHF